MTLRARVSGKALLATVLMSLWGQAALSLSCSDHTFEGLSFTTCEADAETDKIRTFLYDDQGQPYGQFGTIEAAKNQQGQTLSFATNGGMFHDDRSPVGHYVENGRELMRVIPNAGPGNFGMLPNGVFCVQENRADVVETRQYLESARNCDFATQSGPMLVIDGALHHRFLKDSTSRNIRNGVGSDANGRRVVFAISNDAVTFHEFGRFFRDYLNLPSALFLDGRVSRFHAQQLGRSDFGRWLGPIIGVVEPLPE